MRPPVQTIPVVLQPQTPAEVISLATTILASVNTRSAPTGTAFGSLSTANQNKWIQVIYDLLSTQDNSSSDLYKLLRAHCGIDA